MKKFASILALLFVLTVFTAYGFAGETFDPAAAPEASGEKKETAADSKLPDLLMKAYKKMSVNVSFVMEVKTKMGAQEFMSKTTAYFKDPKHYRMDSEVSGQKTRMVVNGDTAWTYMQAANMIMTMPVPPSPADLKKDIDYTEGKDGKNITYTFIDANTKMKVVTTVNPEETLVIKMNTFNEKNELISEMIYSDWKFETIKDETFKKPEGAQEVQAPAQQVPGK